MGLSGRLRLEYVLESSKAEVLAVNEKVKQLPLLEDTKEKMLLKAANNLSLVRLHL